MWEEAKKLCSFIKLSACNRRASTRALKIVYFLIRFSCQLSKYWPKITWWEGLGERYCWRGRCPLYTFVTPGGLVGYLLRLGTLNRICFSKCNPEISFPFHDTFCLWKIEILLATIIESEHAQETQNLCDWWRVYFQSRKSYLTSV
jgi:hypothetical protein